MASRRVSRLSGCSASGCSLTIMTVTNPSRLPTVVFVRSATDRTDEIFDFSLQLPLFFARLIVIGNRAIRSGVANIDVYPLVV